MHLLRQTLHWVARGAALALARAARTWLLQPLTHKHLRKDPCTMSSGGGGPLVSSSSTLHPHYPSPPLQACSTSLDKQPNSPHQHMHARNCQATPVSNTTYEVFVLPAHMWHCKKPNLILRVSERPVSVATTLRTVQLHLTPKKHCMQSDTL